MLNVLSFFGLANENRSGSGDFRRKRVRYAGLRAEAFIGKQTYPVHDWDPGGLAFETSPENYMALGAEVQMTIKFYFPHETITVEQAARVVRIAKRGISAARFAVVPAGNRRQFERVIDNFYTQEFFESQVA